MKRIRSGSGLGDSLYMRPVVDYFAHQGPAVALSDYPDIFIGSGAKVEPFRRYAYDVAAHYVAGKNNPKTNQWQDVCQTAGIEEIAFRMGWSVRNGDLVSTLRRQAGSRPFVLVHGGREPMGRADGFAREMLPRREAMDATLSGLADYFLIGIGGGQQVHYPLKVDADLSGKTSVSDLLDLAFVCHGAVGQCSYLVPLAEIFDKPLLIVWAGAGLSSASAYIKTIRPSKVFCKSTSSYVVDDWDPELLRLAAKQHLLGVSCVS